MGSKDQTEADKYLESFPDHNIDDDRSTVVPPSRVSYSRSQGSFIEDEDYNEAMYDDASTLFSGRSGSSSGIGSSHGHSVSHKRSLSNERLLSAQLSQMNYNNNRVSLGRSILQVQDLLHQVDKENEIRPIHISRDKDENLHVLKVQLKMDGNYSNGNHFDLDKEASAKIFRSQIRDASNHLASLQKRVDDISSKVFITGDVNTGKSSFCNSLLRRNLLPEDQLPCTNVFCEILEARENDNIEEVHAITTRRASNVRDANNVYNIRDKSTYETFQLEDLTKLVEKSDDYILLKIYIKDDKSPAETSLLRNGTVDISLIDSPGLNKDSVQTAEVMARQEEIDLVIFVVNAENQLTLSANEFITLASREKKYMFFVVKKFDRIRDKQRCKDLILKQIKALSPESYKSSSQFVHFLTDSGEGPDGDPHNNPDDDGGDNDGKKEPSPDFEHLENSLRNFVLKKRSLSKLLPAKTYLCKVLSDIQEISTSNMKIYKAEDDCLNGDLNKLRPEYTKTKQHCDGLTEAVDSLSEDIVTSTFESTRRMIGNCLEIPISEFPKYQGISQVHEFVFQTEQFIKDQIKEAVTSSETFAKSQTEECVSRINALGREKLGDDFMSNRFFKSDLMFTKRRHFSIKKLSVPLTMNDFFAPTWEGLLSYLSWGIVVPIMPTEEKGSDENASPHSLSGALGLGSYSFTQYWTKPSLLFTSKIPTLAVYSMGGVQVLKNIVVHGFQFFSWQAIKRISGSLLLLGGFLGAAYLVHDLPRALPENLSAKYKKKLLQNDYAHSNAERISKEVREVLRVPTREIVKSCELVMDKKLAAKREVEMKLDNNSLSIKFFGQLLERATSQRTIVERINLDVD